MNRARLAAGQTASNLLYLALNYYRARSTMGTGGVHRKRLNWMTDLDCSIRNPPPRLRLHARPPPTFSLARVCARVDESTHSRNYYYSCQQKQFFVFLLFLFFFFIGENFQRVADPFVSDLRPGNSIFSIATCYNRFTMMLCNTIWHDTVRWSFVNRDRCVINAIMGEFDSFAWWFLLFWG